MSPPDSDPFNAVEYGRIYANLSRNLSAEADCGFKFQRRGQLFIGVHNESLSIVAVMHITSEDRSPVGTEGCDTT